ncbi:MAG: L-serine ammonia-lyase, iron-sulfur-dependent, subunit alpha [Clostridiales bacterium]|nr:L-serine ammonia-lyase, iron-sulfur-dependent, subunit alpha [Clostridiales bacterium]
MYKSLKEICQETKNVNKEMYEIILEPDCIERGVSEQTIKEEMLNLYKMMKEADSEYEPELMSHSKLVGGDGLRFQQYRTSGESICGDFVTMVMEKAIKMGESNACMKRIVAAPTAGSCGVLPAVLLSMQEKYGFEEEKMANAVIVAAGIGGVIASRAFIAGAAGGCQAEIGAAAAMAAGAVVYLRDGNEIQICNAAALALKNLLGLACDPVGGLVEVPCVKRNVIGALSAVSAAEMTLAGICSKIPPDEVIDAMRNIGEAMPSCLKETSKGGLAVTPEGLKYAGGEEKV